MIILKIYLVICLLWSAFAFYKHKTSYPKPLNCWQECLKTAILNFLICPFAIYIAIKNKKI